MEENQPLAAAEGAQPIPETKPQQSTGRRTRRGWSVALLVLILLMMGGAGVLGYRYWQETQSNLQLLNQLLAQAQREQGQLQQRVERANQAFVAQAQRIDEFDQSFQAQRKVLDEELRKLRLEEDAMQQAVALAQERMGIGSAHWILAEAEYLMRVAQWRLAMDQDVASAREALTAADQRLRETGEPQWAEVREVLGGEISALAAVPVQGLEQTSQLLAALSEEVQGLPLLGRAGQAATGVGGAGAQPAAETGERSLQTLVKDGLAGLESMISVRYHDVPASSLLPPPKQHAVYQHLLLQLETAQYALLRRDSALYQSSLGKAGAWLQDYFDPAAPSTRSFRERLETAATANIRPPLPDISTSLRMLQRRREQARQGDST